MGAEKGLMGLVPRDAYRALVARFWAGGGVHGGEGLAPPDTVTFCLGLV